MKNLERGGEKIEQRELNAEDKKQLCEIWSEVILGRGTAPKNIADLSDNEIRDWLSSSLMSEIKILSDDWHLVPNQELIEALAAEEAEEKSQKQRAYLDKCREKINEFTEQNREEKSKRSTRWDSWPKTMTANNDFNCVGATMVGADLLDRAEIENYYGNPSGHAVNIIRLSDKTWFYVDFRNDIITEIKPEEVEIAGVKTLKIDNDLIDYQLIPLLDKNGLAEFALGNLDSLIKEDQDSDTINLNPGEQAAKKIVKEHSAIIEKVDVHNIYQAIFSDQISLHSSSEMRAEEERIKLAWDFESSLEGLTRKMVNELGKEKALKLTADNANQIEEYFSGAGELSDIPNSLRTTLEKIKESLAELSKKDHQLSARMQKKILDKIKKSKK